MTATPRKDRKNWWLITATIGLILLTLLGVGGYRIYRVATLQNAFANPDTVELGRGRGEADPEWAEKAVSYVVEQSGGTVEDKGVLRERLMAVFRSETLQITLSDPHGFSADIGSSLKRFPSVREFYIADFKHATSEEEAKLLLSHVRQLENLEFLYLSAPSLTDTAFAALAGHTTLSAMFLKLPSSSPQILETLKTLPNLKSLHIDVHENHALSGQDAQQFFRDALPGVQVYFRSA